MTDVEAKILLVDDDESLRRVTSYHLQQDGFSVESCGAADEALRRVEESPADVVVTDVRMPGMSGLDLVSTLKSKWPELGIVVITAHGNVEDAVEAMKRGAHDYLTKPFEHEALALAVRKALRVTALLRENERLRTLAEHRLRFENLVGTSSAMQEVLEIAARVAPRNTTVLILGESGTGKELMARAIHHASQRSDGPFVPVGIGAVSDTLVDSELFGHKKGSFTGADRDRRGKFELAENGTIFLDEIGDLKPELQVKLLRVLQEGEVDPLGSDKPVPVNARVIAATNRDLEQMVADGEFREDLYYRLAVLPLHLPPLRRRKDDIPLLVRHFATRVAEDNGHEVPAFEKETMRLLMNYDWPGNVRELENVVERALVLRPTGTVVPDDLPPRIRDRSAEDSSVLRELPEEGLDLEALEREVIERALEKCGGNQSATARYLRITRNTLLYRLEKFGLRTKGIRESDGR